MEKKGWMGFVALMTLIVGTLFVLVVISDPEQGSGPDAVVSFYQRDTFLIAVIRDNPPDHQGPDLIRKLVAAKYAPVGDPLRDPPYDAVVSITRSGIVVIPGRFFFCNGRYTELDLPTALEAKSLDEVTQLIEVIVKAQQEECPASRNLLRIMT